MLIEKVLDALKILEEYKDKTLEELLSDKKLQSIILWNLYVAVQGTIDLALKIISKHQLRTPESYVDAFRVLAEDNMIPKDLAQRLMEMAKFRHTLAHVYFHVDMGKVHKI